MSLISGLLTRIGDVGRAGERWSVRLLMSASGVRRDKAALSSGCKPHPARGCDRLRRRRRTEGRRHHRHDVEDLADTQGHRKDRGDRAQ